MLALNNLQQQIDLAQNFAVGPKEQDKSHQAAQVRSALVQAWQDADLLSKDDPDIAALHLDGIIQNIVLEWYAEQGLALPNANQLLPRLEKLAPPLAWHLRLALRAPDIEARLIHSRDLLHVFLGLSISSTDSRADKE